MMDNLRFAVCQFFKVSHVLVLFLCFSAGPCSDQLREDPGLALLHVRAAVLPGVNVNNQHIYSSQGCSVFNHVSASPFDMCVQDDHPEGAQQYRAAGNVV